MREHEYVTRNHDLLDDLDARGLIHDSTDRDLLASHLNAGPVTVYCGFDPTSDSLHVGNLLGLLVLRRFQQAGHRPLALAGGATGMVGDPSGRSDERNLLDAASLDHNLAAMSAQITRVLGPPAGWELVNNADWTAEMTLLDFLRDVGKHVTVNQMVAKESVKARMQGSTGISFTEFSYMLLQANDYWWLHTNRGCSVQIGGSDQWGNITAGIDLIRRRGGSGAHGLTWPLLVRADGTKFGKSATGESVWLDAKRTSPYRFFQFWMHADDVDVERLLLQLTLLPVVEITELMAEHRHAPGQRRGQRTLAVQVTGLVHGHDLTEAAQAASRLLFGGDATAVDISTLAMLDGEVPTIRIASGDLESGVDVAALLVQSGLCRSAGDARRTIDQGGGYCNDLRVVAGAELRQADLLHGRYALLRKGRKSYALVVIDDS